MRGLNRVTLIGNLGKEPEFQQLEGNVAVTKFSLATTETFKDKNGQTHSTTDWHTIVLWRSLAELAHKYLQKGSLVFVEGKLKNPQLRRPGRQQTLRDRSGGRTAHYARQEDQFR